MRLSFIVPVYNTKNHLERCIASLIEQDIPMSDYEIILVNDGSTDSTAQLINDLEKKHLNIKSLHKENGGANSARNVGLKYAQGEYIWFVDSDDVIKLNCLSGLLSYAEEKDLDYVDFPINEIIGARTIMENDWNKPKKGVVSGYEWISMYNVKFSPVTFISKRYVWTEHKIFFTEGLVYDDYDVVIYLLECCSRCAHIHHESALYNYYIGREGSITTIKSSEKDKKSIESWMMILDGLKHKYPEHSSIEFHQAVQPYIAMISYMMLNRLLASNLTLAQKKVFLDEAVFKRHFPKIKPKMYPSKINLWFKPVFVNKYIYKLTLCLTGMFAQ